MELESLRSVNRFGLDKAASFSLSLHVGDEKPIQADSDVTHGEA